MTFAVHAASAPAGEVELVLLEIQPPDAGPPLRYSGDNADHEVTLEDAVTVVTFPRVRYVTSETPADEELAESRDTGIPDPDLTLWRRLWALRGSEAPITVTLRYYLYPDLSAPIRVANLELASPRLTRNRELFFTAKSPDVTSRKAPTRTFNQANTPQLRR